ncbi:MAG: hypothetical protein HPY50_04970 [Firmicutes bacterium]|nr:hypothetical protein [Bacillota bacterium]
MDNSEFRRVEAWLYGIPRMEMALENLKLELGRIDSQAASPPMAASNPSGIRVTGGRRDSMLDNWVEFLNDCEIRQGEIRERIKHLQEQIDWFNRVLRLLERENPLLVLLVKKKYLERVKPDQIIWDTVLYVGKTKFYDMRRQALEVFLECLPMSFKKRTNSEPKSA